MPGSTGVDLGCNLRSRRDAGLHGKLDRGEHMSLFSDAESDDRPMLLDGRQISPYAFRFWARSLVEATEAYLAREAFFRSPPEPGRDQDEIG